MGGCFLRLLQRLQEIRPRGATLPQQLDAGGHRLGAATDLARRDQLGHERLQLRRKDGYAHG